MSVHAWYERRGLSNELHIWFHIPPLCSQFKCSIFYSLINLEQSKKYIAWFIFVSPYLIFTFSTLLCLFSQFGPVEILVLGVSALHIHGIFTNLKYLNWEKKASAKSEAKFLLYLAQSRWFVDLFLFITPCTLCVTATYNKVFQSPPTRGTMLPRSSTPWRLQLRRHGTNTFVNISSFLLLQCFI